MINEEMPERLSKTEALKVIRAIVVDDANVIETFHSGFRGGERNVDLAEILQVLRKGYIIDEPYLSMEGDWSVTMRGTVAGRTLEIPIFIDWPNKLIVKTVIPQRAARSQRRR